MQRYSSIPLKGDSETLKYRQDIYVLSGKVETGKGTSATEIADIVKAVAKNVKDLQTGDRVCALAPNSFRTTERVPAWACHKMLPEESFEV